MCSEFLRLRTFEGHNYDDWSIAVMQHAARRRLGRKPIGERPMTAAERKRKQRAMARGQPFDLSGEEF